LEERHSAKTGPSLLGLREGTRKVQNREGARRSY
jgi:hypothetical protein